ncbi:MAG: YbjQ family protein [Firmicutes bacterium]|nr:YbjQ family protein [Bacillota bacterium]
MLVVTTPILEGKKIREYKGPLFCQVTRGVGAFRSMGAGWKNMTGGRSAGHEKSIVEVRATAMQEMIEDAKAKGANAIIDLNLDIEMLSGDSLILCKGYGTAVVVD